MGGLSKALFQPVSLITNIPVSGEEEKRCLGLRQERAWSEGQLCIAAVGHRALPFTVDAFSFSNGFVDV